MSLGGHFPSNIFKCLYGCLVADARVTVLAIVEDFDVFKDCALRLGAGSEFLAKFEKEDAVSIGRVSMMEFSSKEEADHSEELYDKIRAEPFPTLELVVNIRTGPTSILSFAVYPSYESAASNLEGREKFQEEISAGLKDSFFHEGEVTYFFQPEPKPEN